MITKIVVKNLEQDYQCLISNGKHSIVGDEPVDLGGTDMGLAPTDMVLAGLLDT